MGYRYKQYRYPRDSGRDRADYKAYPEPAEESHVNILFFFQKSQRHDIGRRSNQGNITAEASTKKKSPPERLNVYT